MEQLYCFIDTETTGLPNFKCGLTQGNAFDFPRIVQLAYQITDDQGREILTQSNLVASNIESTPKALETHGYSRDFLNKYGLSEESVIDALILNDFTGENLTFVAHNVGFDKPIIDATCLRAGIGLFENEWFCTMDNKSIMDFMNTKKWPRLSELHSYLFGTDFLDAHNALSDVIALKRCFFELKRLGVI